MTDQISKDLQLFTFNEHAIRMILDEHGEPWWVAKDVCDVLRYADSHDAVKRHCKYAKLLKAGKTPVLDLPNRGLLIIPESDLYRLILGSKQADAVRFQVWVTEQMLPSIRKKGSYVAPTPEAQDRVLEEMPTELLFAHAIQRAARTIDDQRALIEAKDQAIIAARTVIEDLGKENQELWPWAQSFKHMADADGAFCLRSAAKIIGILERNFNQMLRDDGYLCKVGHVNRSLKRAENAGLLVTKMVHNGRTGWTGEQVFVTPKGLHHFFHLYATDEARNEHGLTELTLKSESADKWHAEYVPKLP